MIDKEIFGILPKKIGDRITIIDVRHHAKASEAYVDVEYASEDNGRLCISIPVNYRRTGIDASSEVECVEIIESACDSFCSDKLQSWRADAQNFWRECNMDVTQAFFDVMNENLGEWVCQGCQLPTNGNWARRTQEIKEQGYTIATALKRLCVDCGEKKTHLMLLPIPRGVKRGYETWSSTLRKRIVEEVLSSVDAYEGCRRPSGGLLPDHKFPEIRWDENTKVENPDSMTDEQIVAKFQLLSNQRNQHKREVCRKCFQTGERGSPYGIKFFYQGSSNWPAGIARTGADAEEGCRGCGWYDLEAWRTALVSILSKDESRG